MAVLMRDLAAYYQALAGGRRVSLPALRVQYADFAVWQRAKLRGADFEATLAYWRARLSGDLQMPPLPADRPRPQVPSLRGGAARRLAAPALPARLKALSRAQGVTLYMTGLAAFQALIGAYSGARDIVTGCLVSGRGMRASEPLIGLFFNALALRTDLSGDPTVRALLARVRAVALGAFAHQEMPILRLTEALGIRPGPGQSPIPLVPVLFQMRNLPRAGARAETAAGALRIAEFKHGTGMARFDLTFDLAETQEGLLCTLDYNQDLFDATTAARMLEDFENLLAAFVADPGTPLSALPISRLAVSRLAGGRLAGGRPDGPEPGGTEPSGGAAP